MLLNSKQTRYLKSIAMNEKPVFQVGKGLISDNMIDQIDACLEARELIKIRVLSNVSCNAREIGLDIASKTNSNLVQVVGKVITLFRSSKKKIYGI